MLRGFSLAGREGRLSAVVDASIASLLRSLRVVIGHDGARGLGDETNAIVDARAGSGRCCEGLQRAHRLPKYSAVFPPTTSENPPVGSPMDRATRGDTG
jgi:hypothetical protein